jgi:RNA polymerase-binding transcription factor DksA
VADEIDKANDQMEKAMALTMRTINTDIKENDTGECIWCGEPVKDKRRWCSVECRDEQERHD